MNNGVVFVINVHIDVQTILKLKLFFEKFNSVEQTFLNLKFNEFKNISNDTVPKIKPHFIA